MGTSSRPARRDEESTGSLKGAVTYRLFRESDLPGVLRLWETASGWGALTADTWKSARGLVDFIDVGLGSHR